MKTADRLLAGPVHPPFALSRHPEVAASWKIGMEVMRRQIAASPHILADNVATYVHHGPNSDQGFVVENFPCLAPPWPYFWIEYPSRSGRQRRGVGVRDITHKLDDTQHGDDGEGAVANARENGYTGKIGWVVEFTLFIEDARKRIIGPMGWTILALDPAGRAVGNRWIIGIPKIDGMPDPTEAGAKKIASGEALLTIEDHYRLKTVSAAVQDALNDEEVRLSDDQLIAGLLAAWQAIAFLHCKNMVVDDIPARPKLDARHRKQHGRDLLRFQTVRLEVPRRQSSHRGTGEPRSAPALHIVPGNFHHYGNCCPTAHEPKGLLFGKLEGMFWVPQHARGNRERGEIRSDFDLQVKP